jgi:hypothetical protein
MVQRASDGSAKERLKTRAVHRDKRIDSSQVAEKRRPAAVRERRNPTDPGPLLEQALRRETHLEALRACSHTAQLTGYRLAGSAGNVVFGTSPYVHASRRMRFGLAEVEPAPSRFRCILKKPRSYCRNIRLDPFVSDRELLSALRYRTGLCNARPPGPARSANARSQMLATSRRHTLRNRDWWPNGSPYWHAFDHNEHVAGKNSNQVRHRFRR